MNEVKDDPLLTIFQNSTENVYFDKIENIENIPNFFEYIISDKFDDNSKILVLENLFQLFKNNRYITEFFSTYKNKSIYLYLFDLYLNTKTSKNLKLMILKLIDELILSVETDKSIYKYIFQKISKIYNIEDKTLPKTSENFCDFLTLLDTLFSFKEKIPKPGNYFALSGNNNSKFSVDLSNKKLDLKPWITFILNFKIPVTDIQEETSNLISINFSNDTSLEFQLKLPGFFFIKDQNGDMQKFKLLPVNEYMILVINIFFDQKNNLFQIYCFINGENKLTAINCKNNLNIETDYIKDLSFFENFFGEVTSITMLMQNDEKNYKLNTAEFLPVFKNFTKGFHKKKYLDKFIEIISDEKNNKLINNLIFCFTCFNYYNNAWQENCDKNNNNNLIIDDIFGNYTLNIIDQNNSIRNHRYQYYQKKIYLVCDITNFLPIAELFLIYPEILTEKNFGLFLHIIGNIINIRKRNVEAAKDSKFFDILFIFFEKYNYQIFTKKIMNAFFEIGKIMFQNNLDLTANYFKHILLNEKILSKYDKNLQMKFWTQMLLFCQSDSQQLENIIKMNRICLILRYYDKKKFKLMCCEKHLNFFKKEFNNECGLMEPSMSTKLADIWRIIDLIINSQEPKWVLSLFKLLLLDLSPCLTNFIVIAVTKALIRHKDDNSIVINNNEEDFSLLQSIIVVKREVNWLEEFINQLIENKFESIIMNAFNHSLPDVRLNFLKLIYQLNTTLISLNKKNKTKIFFDFMKRYLLPQRMFFEKINDKEILVLNNQSIIEYLKNVILLLIFWANDKTLIEINDEINFKEKEEDINSVINNCELFEIILELIKQVKFNVEIISFFLIRLQMLTKNEKNCDKILSNNKLMLMLIDIIYECYKLNSRGKKVDIEMCLSLGIEIISDIYIRASIYKAINSPSEKNYPFSEIELIFLWGNTIIYNIKENIQKIINERCKVIFFFIAQILFKILFKYKTVEKIELKELIENNKKDSILIKKFCKKNYLIFLYKLFEFSFEYIIDKINIDISPGHEINYYNSIFLTSMRIRETKDKELDKYWEDFPFFEEIYKNVSYMWNKIYLYKGYGDGFDDLKNMNKVKKYETILEKYIFNKDKQNIFLNDIKYLCSYYIKENNYNNYFESSDKDNFIEISNFDNIIPISFIKMIQISFISILTISISKQNEEEFIKWIKEFKHFIIFILISSCNLFFDEKNKDNKETLNEYINIQEQISYVLYTCLYFFYQLRIITTICSDKIDKICSEIFLICFTLIKYYYKNKKKIKNNSAKKSAVFILFFDYLKIEENNLLTLEKIEELLEQEKYKENIINFLDEENFKKALYSNNELNNILYQKYFPFIQYKKIIENRLKTVKRINVENTKKKIEFNDKDILDLLPSYEKELALYSNNSLEQRLIWKNIYKNIKKNIFSWNGYWANKTLFFTTNKINPNNNNNPNLIKTNDEIADKQKISRIKYKIKNHYTKSFMKPILIPIFDINNYLPDFSEYDSDNLFINKPKVIVNMDIDIYTKFKEDNYKRQETVIMSKENYLKKIYYKSNKVLFEKLSKISDSLDLGKEDEFSLLKEDKNNLKENNNQKVNYYLCCLVKPSHHIKGVFYLSQHNINFKVFMNQKTGNAMTGVNLGFTDKDDDYDINRKTCYGSYFMFHQKDKNIYKFSIKFDDIKFLVLKRYFYKNSAFEIFTKKNQSYFFNFKHEKDRKIFVEKIIKILPKAKMIINDMKEFKDNLNVIGYCFVDNFFYKKKAKEKNNNIELSRIIKEWNKWRMNNFSFLMLLNFFSSRSFNDLSQYPVFPWILNKYSLPVKFEQNCLESSLYYNYLQNDKNNNNNKDEMSINISSDNSVEMEDKNKKKKKNEENYNYRDMKLPMGMMELSQKGKKRKEESIEKYNDMKENQDDHMEKPFFFGSNYSNHFYVCNFLMRLFPFTHISIELQGNLDDPNRLFLSVENSFMNSTELQGDVRELIPEFFYLPEMFLNINDINLGHLEDGNIVYNVKTPCKNNSYAFIELMNRILNGDIISKNINDWIDLIFGSKNKGKEAENAKNIFTEKSYQENINLNNVEDKTPFLARAEYGLIPTQILNKECQKRKKKKELKKEKEITEYNMYNTNNNNKIKNIKIKKDSSFDKKIKNLFNDKNINANNNNDNVINKLITIDIFDENKLMLLYENNIITENEINSSNENINNIYKLNPFINKINNIFIKEINNKIYKFFNQGKNIIIGGFYDGKIEVIYLEEKGERKRETIFPFSEEEPILCIHITKNEDYLFLGNSVGNMAIYQIIQDKENSNFNFILFQKIFNQKKSISDIDINLDLNILATSSINGNINLFTWPLCKLFRVIKTPKYDTFKCSKIFLSESSLPSIIIILEKKDEKEILSYSINGEFLMSIKESKNISNVVKIKNLNSYEYLAYFVYDELKIINLPSLSTHLKINMNNYDCKFIAINNDLNTIFGISEDGTQIQTIKS